METEAYIGADPSKRAWRITKQEAGMLLGAIEGAISKFKEEIPNAPRDMQPFGRDTIEFYEHLKVHLFKVYPELQSIGE